MWQIACQAAEINKVPVIFVSLEQSKKELRAKALARFSKLQYRHILRGRLKSDDPQDLQKAVGCGPRSMPTFAQHLTIIEGDDTTTIDKRIYELASAMTAKAGLLAVWLSVDYLQVLPVRPAGWFPCSPTPRIVWICMWLTLRRMARKLDSPVLAISSENRAELQERQEVGRVQGKRRYRVFGGHRDGAHPRQEEQAWS